MSELAKLDERVSRLEREMGDVRKLAASASAEVGDVHTRLRAHTKSLEALRKTQLEQGNDIRALRSEMREGFSAVDMRFATLEGEMREGFGAVDIRFATLEGEMREGFGAVDIRFATLEGEMREGFSTMGVGMAQINALLRIAIDQPDDES